MIEQSKVLLQEKSVLQAHPKTWGQRVADLQESWDNSRNKIFETVLSGCTMPMSCVCKMCLCESPLIRCRQCGIDCLLCGKCDADVHACQPLHDRELWQSGFFQPILPTQGLNSEGNLRIISKWDCIIHVFSVPVNFTNFVPFGWIFRFDQLDFKYHISHFVLNYELLVISL